MTFEWRTDPKLQGRFHTDYPDDLQVIVHDGGLRLTDRRPELIWVRIIGCSGSVFRGRVLNQPQQLQSTSEGAEISFVVPDRGEHPIRVSEKYLGERQNWVVEPCANCGLSELFDAPSDLVRARLSVAADRRNHGSLHHRLRVVWGRAGGSVQEGSGLEISDPSCQTVVGVLEVSRSNDRLERPGPPRPLSLDVRLRGTRRR